jgi:RNA polymerase sigma factor (sigma-70 family)
MKVAVSKSKEQELIEGLRQGEVAAMKEIYRTYFSPILGFIRKHGGNEEDAKDMFQEGVMVMYRMVQKPDFELKGAFLSLLFPICRNLWYKAVRKRPYYVEIGEEEVLKQVSPEAINEAIEAREVDTLFREKFRQLGDTCQRLLNMFFDGFSMKEIMATMELSSVSFAKKKKFQCKEKLILLVRKDPKFSELRV